MFGEPTPKLRESHSPGALASGGRPPTCNVGSTRHLSNGTVRGFFMPFLTRDHTSRYLKDNLNAE